MQVHVHNRKDIFSFHANKTTEEYKDICGARFDEASLDERLRATNFLYPKHVEVIEDISPIASAMVDDIVSRKVTLHR